MYGEVHDSKYHEYLRTETWFHIVDQAFVCVSGPDRTASTS